MPDLVWPVTAGIEMRSSKTISWDGEVVSTGSGRKKSNTSQLLPLWNIEVKFGILSETNAKTILGFLATLKGGNTPFFWLDPEDNQETGIQLPRNTDGTYQCVMKYGGYVEAVEKVADLKVYKDGVLQTSGYTVSGGTISFSSTPSAGTVVTADYQYYWKLHLPAGKIKMDHVFKNFKKTGNLKFESWR